MIRLLRIHHTLFLIFALVILSATILFIEHPVFTEKDPVTVKCCYPWFKGMDPNVFPPHDDVIVHFPYWMFQIKSLQKGDIPIWNPYLLGGMPMWVNVPPLFDPFMVVGLFFPTAKGFIFINFAWIVILGIAWFAFARSLGLEKFSSFAAAYFILVCLIHKMRLYAYQDYLPSFALFPFVLFFAHRFFVTSRFSFFLYAALFHGLMFLMGNALLSIYFSLFLLMYFIYGYNENKVRMGLSRRNAVILLFIFFSFGIGIGSANFLPTVDSILEGHRTVEKAFRSPWHWSPINIIQVILPRILSQRLEVGLWRRTYTDLINENTPFHVSYNGFYLGVIPLILILFAWRRQCPYPFRCFKAWIIFILLFLMGSTLPVFSRTVLYTNPYTTSMLPDRLITLLIPCCSFIACFGLDAMIKERQISREWARRLLYFSIVVFILWAASYLSFFFLQPFLSHKMHLLAEVKTGTLHGVTSDYYRLIGDGILASFFTCLRFHIYFPFLLAGFAVLLMLSRKEGKERMLFFYGGLLALMIFDSFVVAPVMGRAGYPFSFHYPETPAIRYLKKISSKGRMVFLSKENAVVNAKPGELDFPYHFVFPSNTFTFFGLRGVNGYHGVILKRYYALIKASGERLDSHNVYFENPENPVLPLLGVRYAVTTPEMVMPKSFHLLYDGEVRVWENAKAYPEVYIVHKMKYADRDVESMEWLKSKNFNPGIHEAVIENSTTQFPLMSKGIKNENVSVLKRLTSREMVIRVVMKSTGAVVITNPFSRGWMAYVDGSKSRIFPANFAFQAVLLKEGEHVVRLAYNPLSFKAGVCVSLIFLCALFLALFFIRLGILPQGAHSVNH